MNSQDVCPSRPTVAMLSFGRTGTNFLLSKLMSSQELLVAWEPFNLGVDSWFEFAAFPEITAETRSTLQDLDLRRKDPLAFLDQIKDRSGLLTEYPRVKAVVFKVFPTHNFEIYERLCNDADVRCIFVDRENVIEMFASYQRAVLTNQYAVLRSEIPSKARVDFDPGYFSVFYSYQKMLRRLTLARLSQSGKPWLHLSYEDFTAKDFSFDPVFDFCGVKSVPPMESPLRKQGGSVLDRFSDPEGVRATLAAKWPELVPQFDASAGKARYSNDIRRTRGG